MKFVVDAQLPRRLARELVASGHDAVHTLDLPAGNHTQDKDIVALAIQETRVVVVSFLLRREPPKLLLISTGNISNNSLSKLVASNLTALEKAFTQSDFVELSATTITVHS